MSDTKWTPGPWWVVEKYADRNVFVRAEGGMIAEGPYPSHYSNQDERFEQEKAERYANASLISAAPDMAEALERFLDHYVAMVSSGDCGFWNPEDEAHVKAARSALAKARGET